jgi:hypothetical protein
VAGVHGAPGVGKSALAVHAGHLSAARFPDRQLHVNLGGATPLSPAGALCQVLRALGVPQADLPGDVEAAVFRALVAGRRLLIMLDDAATAAQVRPVAARRPGSAVLVTGRTRLAGLADVTHLRLGPLRRPRPARCSTVWSRAHARPRPPGETERLAELCDHLPLGLHIAAARLNARPTWSVRDLVVRLTDEQHRLAELTAGDVEPRGTSRSATRR